MSNPWEGLAAAVTGGAGFIGSNLARRLLESGARVTVIDNFYSGKRKNLDFVRAEGYEGRFTLCETDIRDYPELRRAVAGSAVVFHLAALGSVPASVAEPELANEVNVTGSLNVLRAARAEGVGRVVFSSSSAVYGDNPALPKEETMRPEPESPYASSKIAMEYYAANFHRLYGLETVILRYFNVFGPHQDPHSQYAAVIPIFVSKLLSGVPPVIFGDGEQTRDFVHVEDVVRANLLAARAEPKALGAPINVAQGRRITVNQLFRRIKDLLAAPLEPAYAPARAGDVRHSVAAVARAKDLLGFEAAIPVEAGLERSIGWYRRDHEENRGKA